MSQSFIHCGKHITFKDSLSLINMKLAKFPSSFNLQSGEKEMFPYKYCTFKLLHDTNVGVISEAGKQKLPNKWN